MLRRVLGKGLLQLWTDGLIDWLINCSTNSTCPIHFNFGFSWSFYFLKYRFVQFKSFYIYGQIFKGPNFTGNNRVEKQCLPVELPWSLSMKWSLRGLCAMRCAGNRRKGFNLNRDIYLDGFFPLSAGVGSPSVLFCYSSHLSYLVSLILISQFVFLRLAPYSAYQGHHMPTRRLAIPLTTNSQYTVAGLALYLCPSSFLSH